MKIALILGTLLLAGAAHAEDCSKLIELAKTRKVTVRDQDKIEQAASKFCSEYAEATKQGKSMTATASFEVLNASAGYSSESFAQTASKYCDQRDSSTRSGDAYQEWVEDIAPGAFDAYTQCLKNNDDVSIAVGYRLNKSAQITVNFANTHGGGNVADLSVDASPGVNCHWKNGKTDTKISSPGSSVLSCQRANDDHKDAITVTRGNGTGSLTLLWPKYVGDNPVDTMEELQRQVDSLEGKLKDVIDNEPKHISEAVSSAVSTLEGSLKGVVAFAHEDAPCATGYTDLGTLLIPRFQPSFDTSSFISPGNKPGSGDWNGDRNIRLDHVKLCTRP